MRIVNNGLIEADLAITTGSPNWPATPSGQTIENNAGGIIRGDIVGELAAYLVRFDVPFDAPLVQRAGKPCGSGWTKVGGNQDVFQFSNGFRVELPPCEDAGDPVYEPRRRF